MANKLERINIKFVNREIFFFAKQTTLENTFKRRIDFTVLYKHTADLIMNTL